MIYLVLPIGISGSGKSRLYNEIFKQFGYELVSPDNIRKELTGDISNQSKNDDVFKVVDKKIDDCNKRNVNIFYDATNVNTYYRKKFVNTFKNRNVQIHYYILPADIDLSLKRIKNDLNNNICRSNVSYEVLKRQKKLYDETINSSFKDENVHKITFVKE